MFSKSVYSRWMVLLVLLMACSVLVLGCSQVSEKASEKLAEKHSNRLPAEMSRWIWRMAKSRWNLKMEALPSRPVKT
jgi:hypothetical protein